MNENPFSPQAQEQRLAADVRHDVRVGILRRQLSAGLLMTALGGAAFVVGVSDTLFPNPEAATESRTEALVKLIGGIAGGGFVATVGGLTIYDARQRLDSYGE